MCATHFFSMSIFRIFQSSREWHATEFSYIFTHFIVFYSCFYKCLPLLTFVFLHTIHVMYYDGIACIYTLTACTLSHILLSVVFFTIMFVFHNTQFPVFFFLISVHNCRKAVRRPGLGTERNSWNSRSTARDYNRPYKWIDNANYQEVYKHRKGHCRYASWYRMEAWRRIRLWERKRMLWWTMARWMKGGEYMETDPWREREPEPGWNQDETGGRRIAGVVDVVVLWRACTWGSMTYVSFGIQL